MHRWSPALVLALALALAGCSGSEDPAASPTPVPSSPAPTSPPPTSPEPSAEASGGVYLALGDSLAAGYQPGGTELRESAYPALAAARLDGDGGDLTVENLACSGETTTTFLEGGKCPGDSQLERAEAVLSGEEDVRLVSIDIGGNDLLRCVDARSRSVDAACVEDGLGTVRENLPTILDRLRSAAGPDVPVLVVGYYNPWLAAGYLGEGQDQLTAATDAYTDLDDAVAEAAREAGAVSVPLTTAFGLEDETPTEFGGRQVPTNVAQVCTLTYICTAFDIHLTDEGAAVVGRVVADAAQEAGVA